MSDLSELAAEATAAVLTCPGWAKCVSGDLGDLGDCYRLMSRAEHAHPTVWRVAWDIKKAAFISGDVVPTCAVMLQALKGAEDV